MIITDIIITNTIITITIFNEHDFNELIVKMIEYNYTLWFPSIAI